MNFGVGSTAPMNPQHHSNLDLLTYGNPSRQVNLMEYSPIMQRWSNDIRKTDSCTSSAALKETSMEAVSISHGSASKKRNEEMIEGRPVTEMLYPFDHDVSLKDGAENLVGNHSTTPRSPWNWKKSVEGISAENVLCGGDLTGGKETKRSKHQVGVSSPMKLALTDGNTRQILARTEGHRLPLSPIDVNASRSEPTPKHQTVFTEKQEPAASAEAKEGDQFDDQHPPLSFILTRGGPSKRRRGGRRSCTTAAIRPGAPVGQRWLVKDGSIGSMDISELSQSIHTFLGSGRNELSRNDAAGWRHRCIFAERQLSIAVRCLWEYHNAVVLLRENETPADNVDEMNPILLESDEKLTSAAEAEQKQGLEEVFEKETEAERIEQQQRPVVPSNGEDDPAKAVVGEELNALASGDDHMEQECGVSRPSLVEGALVHCEGNLDYVAEERQVTPLELTAEWLEKEKILRVKQEILATALRQARLTAIRTMERIEQREQEFQSVRSRCVSVQTALLASEAEVKELKLIERRRLRENRRLQHRLNELNAQLERYGTSWKAERASLVYVNDLNDDNELSMSESRCQDVETQLLHVIAAIQCGESRREWISTQILQALKCVDGRRSSKKVALSNQGRLRKLVESIQQLQNSMMGMAQGSSSAPASPEAVCDDIPSARKSQEGDDELFSIAEGCIARLSHCVGEMQAHHLSRSTSTKQASAERDDGKNDKNPPPVEVRKQQSVDVVFPRQFRRVVCTNDEKKTEDVNEVRSSGECAEGLRPLTEVGMARGEGCVRDVQPRCNDDFVRPHQQAVISSTECTPTLHVVAKETVNEVKQVGPGSRDGAAGATQPCDMVAEHYEEWKESLPALEKGSSDSSGQFGGIKADAPKSNRAPGLYVRVSNREGAVCQKSPVSGGCAIHIEGTPKSESALSPCGRLTMPPYCFTEILGTKVALFGNPSSGSEPMATASASGGEGAASGIHDQIPEKSQQSESMSAHCGQGDGSVSKLCAPTPRPSPKKLPSSMSDSNLGDLCESPKIE
uniref:Uncharacterized protein n=1 Tax=Trypanosoma congolense (strain IL3000) TaxID=1068625 RepID=G0UY56_TRYCI|nr:conserved hypothetical protein [Trypanosoma congolense IL3000]